MANRLLLRGHGVDVLAGGPGQNLHLPGVQTWSDRVTWPELVHNVRELANHRRTSAANALAANPTDLELQTELWWMDWFLETLERLIRLRLRGATTSSSSPSRARDPSSSSRSRGWEPIDAWPKDAGAALPAWCLGKVFAKQGVFGMWDDFLKRIDFATTLFLPCGQTPLLMDEANGVRRRVPKFEWYDVDSRGGKTFPVDLHGVHVLYLAGHNRMGFDHLHFLRCGSMPLAILNVCCSEELGGQLLEMGVQRAVCWPGYVDDDAACKFGLALVENLCRYDIAEAFSVASESFELCMDSAHLADQPPKLIARDSAAAVPHPLGGSDQVSRSSCAGEPGRQTLRLELRNDDTWRDPATTVVDSAAVKRPADQANVARWNKMMRAGAATHTTIELEDSQELRTAEPATVLIEDDDFMGKQDGRGSPTSPTVHDGGQDSATPTELDSDSDAETECMPTLLDNDMPTLQEDQCIPTLLLDDQVCSDTLLDVSSGDENEKEVGGAATVERASAARGSWR